MKKNILIVLIIVISSLWSIAQDSKVKIKEPIKKNSGVEIQWEKATAFKGKYQVYRSTTGKIFIKVGEVSKNDTTFMDKTIKETGLYYYQIMAKLSESRYFSEIKEIQVDVDNLKDTNLKSGSINSTNSLAPDLAEQLQLNVYPTVFSSELNITLDGSVKNLKLFDMSGKELYGEVVELKKGIHTIQLGHLSKGTYILSADNEPFKVIKE